MRWLMFLVAVLTAIIILLLLQRFTTLQFVSHARLLFKTWSVWLASLGSMLSAWAQSFPSAAVDAWNVLPEDVKSILPHNYLGLVGAFMVAMGVIAQFVRQKNLLNAKEQAEGAKHDSDYHLTGRQLALAGRTRCCHCGAGRQLFRRQENRQSAAKSAF